MSSSLSSSATLCQTAEKICLSCTPFILDAPFCAYKIQEGNGNAGDVQNAAQAWKDTGQQLSQARDQLASLVNSIPTSEWQSTDRELYQQTAQQYLQQLDTSATAAGVAGDMLTAAAYAIFTFAGFAMGVASALAVAAAAVAAADLSVFGAPEAEALGAEAGAAAMEALEGANTVLQVALDGVAAGFGIGTIADTVIQISQGNTAATGDFTQAVVTGLKDAIAELPQELLDTVKDKAVDSAYKGMHPGSASSGGTTGAGD